MANCSCFEPTLRSDHAACSECGGDIESATPHFNALTPAEHERLTVLAEECGEVIQAAMKIMRHGYRSRHPDKENGPDNRESLEFEIGHVLAAVNMLTAAKDVRWFPINQSTKNKLETIRPYLHHQGVTE